MGVPRTCGGDPVKFVNEGIAFTYSPRKLGAILLWIGPEYWAKKVFPAYAGVILLWRIKLKKQESISRICGGDLPKADCL